jgi:hypothetical protein
MFLLTLTLLHYCIKADHPAANGHEHDAYFARLAERGTTDPDGAVHRHWSDFVALCDALAFERGTIHFMPLSAMSLLQQHTLLARIRGAGWTASIEPVRVTLAKPQDARIQYGPGCHCRVLALDTPGDNATNYRRMRTAWDQRAGLDEPVGVEIILPGVQRERTVNCFWLTSEWGRPDDCTEQYCDCTNDVFAPLTVLRLDTTRPSTIYGVRVKAAQLPYLVIDTAGWDRVSQ